MLSPRAPLFSVSLAFASGCLLALDGVLPLPAALFFLYAAAVAWLILGRFPGASLVAFYVLAASTGLVHTLLIGAAIPAADLRRLPDAKTLESTQWRGVITEEPVAQLTSHVSRRALDRTSFVLAIEAWRPTGGRLFGADIETPWQTAKGNVQCTLIGPARELRCGDQLEFATALEPIAAPLVPGDLDLRAFEARQGIYYSAVIRAMDWQRTQTGAGDWWQELSFRARDWAYSRLQIGLEDDPRTADFLAGMLIGYRQEIPTDIEQDFRRTGTIHVFAVSGQNVAELMVVAVVLLQLCGLVRWRWAWMLVPLLLVYCLLTGSPASAIRATVMALTVLLAWRLGRPLNALGCWSLALWAMLMWDPSVLLDPGAQLSFGVVLALILLASPIVRLLVRPFQHDLLLPSSLMTVPQRMEERFWLIVMGLFGSGVAAMLISEPITALQFHQVTPISVVANMIAVPLAGLITTVGTLSVATSLLSTTWAGLINNSNWLLAHALIIAIGFFAHEPGASINVADLSTLAAPKPFFVIAPLRDSACLLIRAGPQAWLINTGRESATPSSVWHLLQFYGINRLDGLVLAQLSVAENGGAEAIVRDFRPRRLVLPALPTHSPFEKRLPSILALAGTVGEKWARDESFTLGRGVGVHVLNPPATSGEGHEENRSLVLLFHAAGYTILWAGAIDPSTQGELRARYPNLRADVLVLNGDTPPTSQWLAALGVRVWLQIPPRDRQLNAINPAALLPSCAVWPLYRSGAVLVNSNCIEKDCTTQILLRPWLQLP